MTHDSFFTNNESSFFEEDTSDRSTYSETTEILASESFFRSNFLSTKSGARIVVRLKSLDTKRKRSSNEVFESAIIDPYLRERPKDVSYIRNWLVLPLIFFVILTLLFFGLGVDRLFENWILPDSITKPTHYHYNVSIMFWTLLNPEHLTTFILMQAVLSSMSNIFGFILSFIGIFLQRSSEDTSPHVINLFFRDPYIIVTMIFSAFTCSFACWVFLSVGSPNDLPDSPFFYPRIGVFVCVLLVTFQYASLFPFFFYVLSFVNSENVVTTIMVKGLKSFSEVTKNELLTLDQIHNHQIEFFNCSDYLMDAAISSLKKQNDNMVCEVVDALCSYYLHYLDIKCNSENGIPSDWFSVCNWIRGTLDFLVLESKAQNNIVERGLWVEWKILRQFQVLFCEGITNDKKELCFHICANTRTLAEVCGSYSQMHALDLCIKFFNTFLRVAINVNGVKIVYNTLFQYRVLAEDLIIYQRNQHLSLQQRYLLLVRSERIAKYLIYYAQICQQKSLFFLVETVAQDLRFLIQTSVDTMLFEEKRRKETRKRINQCPFRKITESVFDLLLSLATFVGNSGSKRGVLRSLCILACTCSKSGNIEFTKRIVELLDREENKEMLMSLNIELHTPSQKEFWEISERGSNFSYLDPTLIDHLDNFFELFPWFTTEYEARIFTSDFWLTADGKNLRMQQDLNNFACNLDASDEEEEEEENLSDSNDSNESIKENSSQSKTVISQTSEASKYAQIGLKGIAKILIHQQRRRTNSVSSNSSVVVVTKPKDNSSIIEK